MNEAEFRFDGDKVFLYTQVPSDGAKIYRIQLVMTKEIFQECYKKWIEQEEGDETNDKNN